MILDAPAGYPRRFTKVHCLDEPGPGGAYHEYEVSDWDAREKVFGKMSFQNGPVPESGVNGLMIEDLLDICAHRLDCFQSGPFVHPKNGAALDHVIAARKALNDRTKERLERGVEGTHIV
jgi:hypothetical protein